MRLRHLCSTRHSAGLRPELGAGVCAPRTRLVLFVIMFDDTACFMAVS